jgi:2-polyprenyl-6-methoxyphenol hydroxylase-like FAD-dependent oxidoreductase
LFLLTAREEEPGPKRWERRAVLDYMHARFHDLGWEAQDMLSAAEGVESIYIDGVSQIRLRRWWRGHAALLGDAAYAPSLLAGQGSALAIIGAYVLAGELSRSVTPEGAFERYQQVLGAFILRKQDAATKFAGTFVPKTNLGIWLRNVVTRAMTVPAIARVALGDSLKDDLDLPDYSRRDTATTTTGGESSAVLSPRL